MTDRILTRKITVCAHCLQASCWQGIFLCDQARSAGTTELSVLKLHQLAYENPEYWFKDANTGAVDQHAMAEYRAVDHG